MPEQCREERLAAAFVELADTLVGDFDVIHFLYTLTEHCVTLFDIAAAGVVLATPRGELLDATASDERTRAMELASIEWDEGPCHDCYRTGRALYDIPLDHPRARAQWPRVSRRARELGFTSVSCAPLRLRDEVIGALNLFRDRPGSLAPGDLRLAQALADTAAIGILQQRAVHERGTVAAQLQIALNSRIIIEQAKGALADRRGISVDEAFDQLRRSARHHGRLLADVAREVMATGTDPTPIDPLPPRGARPV
ncbi:GAF and ANTAR domain-containing protein [Streptomyces sp. NPDC041068]|uniref:GAF and ANTAR domain-containing protein n=1 Tax=Streptomyces sp. NPDC041068 TaxID=3155130 RepID=UPI0033E341AB